MPGTVPSDILKVNTYKLELRIFSPKVLFLSSHLQRHPHPFRCFCQERGTRVLDTSLFSQLPHIKLASCAISLKHILNLFNFPHNHYLHTGPSYLCLLPGLRPNLCSHIPLLPFPSLSIYSPTRIQGNSVKTQTRSCHAHSIPTVTGLKSQSSLYT